MANERIGDIIERLSLALARLTLLSSGEDGVIEALARLLGASEVGDPRTALAEATGLTRALLTSGARRVSGDIMMDWVLDRILLSDNPFARLAAQGKSDTALENAMRRDLEAMRVISLLDESTVGRLVAECAEARRSDPAVKFATAAWSGSSGPASVKDRRENQVRYDENCWSYGEFELRDSYAADAALEGMYRRFLENDAWGGLVNDLWSFHSAYGSGRFLRYRNFCLDRAGGLSPMPDLRPGDFVQLSEAEYRTLLNNAIAFLRDESAKPMLLYGGAGMGKTTLMLELTDELPQLHLVYVPPTARGADLLKIFGTLRAQPLKFMTLFDDLDTSVLSGVIEPMLPLNVLVAGCAPVPVLESLFEVAVELPRMQLGDFARAVSKLLESEQVAMSQEEVRSACMDYRSDTGAEFSVASAVRVKELLMS